MSEPRQTILGIGGIFFKARDPKALAAWYREHLGVPVEADMTFATLPASGPTPDGAPEQHVWSVFEEKSAYFAPSTAPFMVNYRVADLHALLAQLRAAGVAVDEKTDESEFGKFGWAMDPEGNRFELWEPPPTGI